MPQDDYYYEIQLTNKQLVFYFMAGATGLILSFLAGVMVGRGVDAEAGSAAVNVLREEKVVPESPASAPPADTLTYAKRLEGDRPGTPPRPTARRTPPPATPRPVPSATAAPSTPKPSPPTPRATPRPTVRPTPRSTPTVKPAATTPTRPASGAFTIQVGAFREKKTADSLAARLLTHGFAAYVLDPKSGRSALYNVRVGKYISRAEAERAKGRLKTREKLDGFIVPR